MRLFISDDDVKESGTTRNDVIKNFETIYTHIQTRNEVWRAKRQINNIERKNCHYSENSIYWRIYTKYKKN
jgi:hypothetical protein